MKSNLLTLCLIISVVLAACSSNDGPQQDIDTTVKAFAKGADLSWVTEMEADGQRFYNEAGEETDCFTLMKDLGMNAIRLRVWVNPDDTYGPYCNIEDVTAKAVRAQEAGLDLMIDFHYSDFFADPGKQTKPDGWKDKNMDELKSAVAAHTSDVLKALKENGIAPKWVQIGNETRNGMLWPSGQLWTEKGDIPDGWTNYVSLSNAGYDAAKSIFKDAIVLIHLNNAWEDSDWWFSKFINSGGKFDMIGLSHYPQSESGKTWQDINKMALDNIRILAAKYRRDIMICEIGVKTYLNQDTAAQALEEFMKEAGKIDRCSGVFYWEPQTNSTWKPAYYKTLNWHAYDMGAFTPDNRPSKVLSSFK